jgi:hypothetical protein
LDLKICTSHRGRSRRRYSPQERQHAWTRYHERESRSERTPIGTSGIFDSSSPWGRVGTDVSRNGIPYKYWCIPFKSLEAPTTFSTPGVLNLHCSLLSVRRCPLSLRPSAGTAPSRHSSPRCMRSCITLQTKFALPSTKASMHLSHLQKVIFVRSVQP